MVYTIKWVEEHLGITRKAIRNYEKKGILPADFCRNENKYREYDDKALTILWNIKLLQWIGFSCEEIKSIVKDNNPNFRELLEGKISILQEKRGEIEKAIQIAKTIKLTGQFPSVKEVGSVNFEEFIKKVAEDYNLFRGFEGELIDSVLPYSLDKNNLGDKDHEAFMDNETLLQLLPKIVQFIRTFQSNQYYMNSMAYQTILSEMQNLGYKHKAVQIVVKLMYQNTQRMLNDSDVFTPQLFAKLAIPGFAGNSDLHQMYRTRITEETCHFIAEAISFFAGFDSLELFYEEE